MDHSCGNQERAILLVPTAGPSKSRLVPDRWPAHPSQEPQHAFASPTLHPAPTPLCALETDHRELDNYLHPFFLMMFPNTTSALQSKREREADMGISSVQNGKKKIKPSPTVTMGHQVPSVKCQAAYVALALQLFPEGLRQGLGPGLGPGLEAGALLVPGCKDPCL